jgi:hypothetical protein
MKSLEHVIYASVADHSLTEVELAELLQKARQDNEHAGLTGMLLHGAFDGSFFQVLEGNAEAIDRLMAKIMVDKRHSHVTQIIREPIVRRSFQRWTMGFNSVSAPQLISLPEFNDFFQAGSCFTDLDPGRAKKLLAAFGQGRWRPKQLGGLFKAA